MQQPNFQHKYNWDTILEVDDEDEILEEIRSVFKDLEVPWKHYYGIKVDKQELENYIEYLFVRFDDVFDHEAALQRYKTGQRPVTNDEVVLYYQKVHGIDLSKHRVTTPIPKKEGDQLEAEAAMNQMWRMFGSKQFGKRLR